MNEKEIINFPQVEKSDISLQMPDIDETEIVIQRHGKYVRNQNYGSDEIKNQGSLTPESAFEIYQRTSEILTRKFELLTPDECQNVEVLVVASNTHHGPGMRSMETANEVLRAINDVFAQKNLGLNQILNNRKNAKGVSPIEDIQEPHFLKNVEFVEFLIKIHGGINKEFWKDFETDSHQAEREQMGAEGPDELIERFTKYILKLTQFSTVYHKKNPGKRLLIWSVSHYDTISPFTKRYFMGVDPKDSYMPVDYGAGLSLKIDVKGKISSNLGGQNYKIGLPKKQKQQK